MICTQRGIIAPTWTHSYQNQHDPVAHLLYACGFERTDPRQSAGVDRGCAGPLKSNGSIPGRSARSR